MRYWIIALPLAITAYSYFVICFLTDGFTTAQVAPAHSYCSKWDLEKPPIEELKTALCQPFHHTLSEKNFYLFESGDGNYQLRLFNQKHFKPSRLSTYISIPAFQQKICEKKNNDKRMQLETLYQYWAAAYLKERSLNSSSFCLHLNKTKHLKTNLLLLDKLKRPRTIDADNCAFILYKKS